MNASLTISAIALAKPSGSSGFLSNTSLAAKGALAHRLSKQLSLNKFFDPSTPSMSGGGKSGEESRGKRKRLMRIVINYLSSF